jgi:dTDP-4-amino-4,6-dideoxygalactose transaminase
MKHSDRLVAEKRRIGIGTFKANDRARELIADVLDTGWISYGPKSKQFELDFAHLHSCRYGVLSNSGTSSLHVALQALKELHGWEDGMEVIVPASTFVATINIVLHNNLKPVFVDIEHVTYGVDPVLVEQAITDQTVCIIPVHLYGQPCSMNAIREAISPWDIKIIEDSCETMFAEHHGELVGSMSDVGCFSLYNAHILTAGVGGVATTNNPAYAMKMRSLVNHGLDIEELNTDENFSPRPAVGRSFRFSHAGHSYRITELEACLALAQLEERRRIVGGRQRNARHLQAGLKGINSTYHANFTIPEIAWGNTHSWMMFPIVLDDSVMDKPHFMSYLNEWNIETRDMMPIVSQPIYQDMLDPNDYPVAKYIDGNGFYIGCHQDLEPEDIEYVLEVIRRYFS